MREWLLEDTELARAVSDSQQNWTIEWHREEPDVPFSNQDKVLMLVAEQHRKNFRLWHTEDLARSPSANDAVIADVKRRIDKLNQERNDLVERIDEWFQHQLAEMGLTPSSDTPWNTETPGAVIDRLSILNLKTYHMREQEERTDTDTAHCVKCREKRLVLEQQRQDLVEAFSRLLCDLLDGTKQLKLYKQFKMYNDPALNPAIYGVKGREV